MTQTPSEKKTTWLVTSSDDDNFSTKLQEACYGQERVSKLLYHLLYVANYEAERQKLPKSCKVVTFSRKHDDILESLKKLNYNISRKTLIRYLDQLDKWEYVGSQRYGRNFTVNAEKIRNALKNPPEKPKKLVYNRRPQKESCSSTTFENLQHSESDELITLRGKVVELQQNVDNLQLKVVELQQNVDNLQLYNFQSASVEMRAEGTKKEDSPLISNIISNSNNKRDSFVATQSSDDTPPFDIVLQPDGTLPISDFAVKIAFEDWIAHLQAKEILAHLSPGSVEKSLPVVENQNMPPLDGTTTIPVEHASNKQEISDSQSSVATPKKPKGGTRRGKQKRVEEPTPELSEEEHVALAAKEAERIEKHRIIYANLVKRRGGEVGAGKIGMERKYVNLLIADGYTPERVDELHRYLSEDDWRYNKPGDRQRITAQLIHSEAKSIELTLADPEYRPRKQQPNHQSVSRPSAASQAPSKVAAIATLQGQVITNPNDMRRFSTRSAR